MTSQPYFKFLPYEFLDKLHRAVHTENARVDTQVVRRAVPPLLTGIIIII